MNWKSWLKGLIAAVVGGATGAIGMVIVDPLTYNLQDGWHKLGWVMIIMGLVSAGMYLKQSPLPDNGTILAQK